MMKKKTKNSLSKFSLLEAGEGGRIRANPRYHFILHKIVALKQFFPKLLDTNSWCDQIYIVIPFSYERKKMVKSQKATGIKCHQTLKERLISRGWQAYVLTYEVGQLFKTFLDTTFSL